MTFRADVDAGAPWRSVLIAAMGEKLDDGERILFRQIGEVICWPSARTGCTSPAPVTGAAVPKPRHGEKLAKASYSPEFILYAETRKKCPFYKGRAEALGLPTLLGEPTRE
jgi:hypothetical protein